MNTTNEEKKPESESETGAGAEAEAEEKKPEAEAEAAPVEEKKETVMVTKRKIRKIALRHKSIPDRLIIKPLSDEERQKSIAL